MSLLRSENVLFNPENTCFIIANRCWDSCYEDIYTPLGRLAARLFQTPNRLRAETALVDSGGRPILLVYRDLSQRRYLYEVRDGYGDLVGRVETKISEILRPTMWVDRWGRWEIIGAQGNPTGSYFQVVTASGRPLAEIKRAEMRRGAPLSKMHYVAGSSLLRFLDPTYDRRTLFGLTIAINNTLRSLKLGELDEGSGLEPLGPFVEG